MKDDILKFRSVCEILRKEKQYTNKQFCQELGISEPTLTKLLKDDINEIKPRASVLGIVQDFNKNHRSDVNYAGVTTEPEPGWKPKPAEKKEPKTETRDITIWMERTGSEIAQLKEEIQKLKTIPGTNINGTRLPIDIEIRINGKRIEF